MSMPDGDDAIVLALTPHEAMLVLAAVRQYEPYWSPHAGGDAAVELARTSADVASVIAKLRVASA